MTAESKTEAESRLCCSVSKGAGDDPCGSGTPFAGYLGIEVAPPWSGDISESRNFPQGLQEQIKKAQDAGAVGKFTGLMPDPGYSREGYTRVLYMRKPEGPFAAYEKSEYLLPDSEVVPFARALSRPGGLYPFNGYRESETSERDILVCTHGSNDVCCGKFGYPIYDELRYGYAAESGGSLRVWRTSHIGGHRFAPTLIDFPEGRYWGHLEPWAPQKLVLRNGPVSELAAFYRGWAGLGKPFAQIAEREILIREGWRWTDYLKSGRVLESEENGYWAEVRIEYSSPDGAVSGAYEATVEADGSVMTLDKSGTGPLQEAGQYRVSRLEEVSG